MYTKIGDLTIKQFLSIADDSQTICLVCPLSKSGLDCKSYCGLSKDVKDEIKKKLKQVVKIDEDKKTKKVIELQNKNNKEKNLTFSIKDVHPCLICKETTCRQNMFYDGYENPSEKVLNCKHYIIQKQEKEYDF